MGLQRSIDALISARGPDLAHGRAEEPLREQGRNSYSADATVASRTSPLVAPPPGTRPRTDRPNEIGGGLPPWFASRDTEWWLSRAGMGFVILGILFLYGYGIDRGWITPAIRVFAGLAAGGGLVWVAHRLRPLTQAAGEADSGFRDLLLGGALAIWYLTAYAAAVWYQMIPIPAARLVFFVLGVVSTWIALEERREIFALVAVVTGFVTPFVLRAPAESMTALSLYLAAVAAMGLIIYLLRGWQSILWITFLGFWASVQAQIGPLVR